MKELTMEKFWEIIDRNSYKSQALVHEHFNVSEDIFGRFNGLNTSSLYSFLIKEAGRLCDHYASDLFIDLKTLDEALMGDDSVLFKQDYYQWVIGIRDYGCDHDCFIKCRMQDCSVARNYRKVYYLEVKLDPDAKYGRYFDLDLYDVSIASLELISRREMAV